VSTPASQTEIDESFVARVSESAVATVVDDEVLVLHEGTGVSVVLDGTGAIVWQCLDNESTIGEICADLADTFQVPQEQVTADVIPLVLQLGYLGMVEGIAPPPPPPPPASAPPGTALDNEPRPGLDGLDHSLADLAGRPAVVINWSASCGWCQRVAPELVDALPRLRASGVALALVIQGDPDANLAFLAESGLAPDITLIAPQGSDPIFERHGTPVAYAVDEAGVTTAPLARGAREVPALIATLTDG
jgi:hypothetical protein